MCADMIEKSHILAEIVRTAATNDGNSLGVKRFLSETGIRQADWYGIYWRRWSEALAEAGFKPNPFSIRYGEEYLLSTLANLTRELGYFPGKADLMLKRRREPSFPSHVAFLRTFKGAPNLARKLGEFCASRPELSDLVEICQSAKARTPPAIAPSQEAEEFGTVYLLRSGRYFKIGRSNAVGRRERELAIQLPEKAQVVHSIRTDDPPGIEAYWHHRFVERRKNGEWFDLTPMDVAAFRRRKFM